jgi:isocitrate/isopropylmalate dehydrogenase
MTQTSEIKTFNSARGAVDLVIIREATDVYFVCSPEEYETSRRERRQPRLVGFRKTDVMTK